MRGLSGRLISQAFARDGLGLLGPAPPEAQRALERWNHRREEGFGPASPARAIADGVAVPLLRLLGFSVLRRADAPEHVQLTALAGDLPLAVNVFAWTSDLAREWRRVVLSGIGRDARWSLCTNGQALRIYDAHRTWSRDYAEFEFAAFSGNATLMDVAWHLVRAESFSTVPSALDDAVTMSAAHGRAVCRGLGQGVLAALTLFLRAMAPGGRAGAPAALFEQSLTVVYRLLFLLFAEARALVPVWHPVYRDRYTIQSIVSRLVATDTHRGTWAAVQAISRLAHAGVSAGELTVTAFNGRLFAPAHAPAFDRRRLTDAVMNEALLAVSTTSGRTGRVTIQYRDLDVEQLGAVYERVLEYEPTGETSDLSPSRDSRKATGTFYTPRQVTAYLVRRTLAPLVRDKSSDDILSLRVLDPAMGSGAFLVGACRYLAQAAEEALVREGRWHAGDVTPADRAGLRRDIAQRCLFGVDLNPVAVQLARLSLWLATLASGKPLTFLDHHLAVGDSLVGATFDDVRRQPGGGGKGVRPASLPLFDEEALAGPLREAVKRRVALAARSDDTVAIVRDKERELAAIHAPGSALGRWQRVLDLWCAGWFTPRQARPDRAVFGELMTLLLQDGCALGAAVTTPIIRRAEDTSAAHRFFHWPVAFPEVFRDASGEPVARAGFDAIVGNPPWDMVRGDSGTATTRESRREDARGLTGFIRGAGIYRVEALGHVNRYALFVERALHLIRAGGRIGFVLPAGAVSDVGTATLRRHLFARTAVDEVTGLDNRGGIFPIHRGVRFVLTTCTAGSPTRALDCRFGISDPEALEAPPRQGGGEFVRVSAGLLARLSGADDMGLPELRSVRDLQVVERITARVPRTGDESGWNLRFGRELNASDDREAFVPRGTTAQARPVLEGKQIEPFRSSPELARHELRSGVQVRVPRRARLAYRDVASATNRMTLIAAIIPARAVTTHTLFVLKTVLPLDSQHVLCALLNSFVANYLVRLRVNTHVTTTLISQLRLPRVSPGTPLFAELLRLATTLAVSAEKVEGMDEYVALQALVARLYGLTAEDFEHILGTFPLISSEVRQNTLTRFIGHRDTGAQG